MAAKVWDSDKQTRLIKMYKSGKFSANEMAFKLNVSQPTVYNRIRSLRLTPQRLPRR